MRLIAASALMVAGIVLASCGGGRKRPAADAFGVEVYIPREAERFRILGAEGSGSLLLEVTNPWQGARDVSSRLLVLAEGEEAPEGFEGTVLRGPAQRVAVMSSTYIAMLDMVGAVDRVVGVSGMRFVSNPRILARAAEVADLGYDGAFDYERLLAAKPDVVLLYGVNGCSVMEEQLRRLGIPYVYIAEYLEQSPVGRAEWMVAVGAIVGSLDRARSEWAGVKHRYDSLAASVAQSREKRPVVMLNSPYGDSWFMPGVDNYAVRLLRDAGAEYVAPGFAGADSRPVDLEEARLMASRADFWLNPGTLADLAGLKASLPRFGDVPAVLSGRVYNNIRRLTPGGGNDYYESGAVRPDLILSDLIAILHPSDSATVSTYYYHIRLK